MTEEKLRQILEIGETSSVEFKRCGNGISDDVYETVCSFSNRFGGDIYCGVQDDRTVCGVPKKAVPDMIRNFISVISNPVMMSPTLSIEPETVRFEGKTIIHIHVPASAEVHSYRKTIFDRVGDADIRAVSTSVIAGMYIRKKDIFTEQKIYEYVELADLRADLVSQCRQMALNRRPDHPWRNLSDLELLKSARLYSKDYETGKQGFNLAAILLLGKDDVIGSVCPAYKTDALVRKEDTERYDDRETIQTNLIESFDLLMDFGRKNLPDRFFLEDIRTVSLRDRIVREMVSNTLMHREFTSPYVAKFVIEKSRMYTENACRASRKELLTPENFTPVSKNPVIAAFFNTIGNADELGSGTRNLFRHSRLYSGKDPIIQEDDIFRTIIPLETRFTYRSDISYGMELHDSSSHMPFQQGLTQNQILILQNMERNPGITALQLAGIIGISSRKTEQNISILKAKGLLERQGSNKNGCWVVRTRSND